MESEGRAQSRKRAAVGERDEPHAESSSHKSRPDDDPACCDVCGVPALVWRKCKLVCENCGSVNKSCADL